MTQSTKLSHRPPSRVPSRVWLWDGVIDWGGYLALSWAGGGNIGVRVQEDIVLGAVSEVVEVQVEGRSVGTLEHLER